MEARCIIAQFGEIVGSLQGPQLLHTHNVQQMGTADLQQWNIGQLLPTLTQLVVLESSTPKLHAQLLLTVETD